jgi:UDP-N-acetylglucosamine transferase subunit ALG13
MIFVTVGTIQFNELVETIDLAVGEKTIKGEVILQIANGSYEPVNCNFFRTVPGLDPYFKRSQLVVSHGGATTLEVLERGIRLISVSNPHLSDNHQHDFLNALHSRKLTRYCPKLTDLPQMIDESLRDEPPLPLDLSAFFHQVIEDIELCRVDPLARARDSKRPRRWFW